MELNNQNGAHVQNGTATETSNDKHAQNGVAKKDTASKGKAEPEKPKPTDGKEAQQHPPKPQAPKAEETKLASLPLSLEGKLRVVEDLHRRSIQRLNLIARIGQLEAFQVALAQENDELEDNPYQGCKLIIEDDKQRKFVTTTPGLIRLVSQYIFDACHEKLVEIETMIVFPVA